MDELSLAALGAGALSGGVTFLYEQAGELLRARRERRHSHEESPSHPSLPSLEAPGQYFEPPPDVVAATARPDVLDGVASSLQRAREQVRSYLDGTAAEDLDSPEAVGVVCELRDLLEQVYGRPLTFRGERRTDSPGGGIHIDVRHGGVHAAGNITVHGGSLAGRDVRG